MKFTAKQIKELLSGSYKSEKFDIDKFKIVKALSDNRVKAYTVDGSSDVVVTHRGSSDARDWSENALYLRWDILVASTSYKMHLKKHMKVVYKYGANNIIVMGHSRGGLYASQLYKDKLAKQVVTYNKPFNVHDILKDIFTKKKQDENSTAIRTSNDLPSVGHNLMKGNDTDIVIPSDSLDPLKEHGTDRLDDYDELIGKGMTKKGKPRVISVKTYRSFMKKYKLNVMKKVNGAYKYKTMKEMSAEILKYETDHEDIKVGLYYEL